MKKMRGISNTFAEAFKNSDLYRFYTEHKDELLIGIRNNYLNLYYNCDSIAKIHYTKNTIWCEIDSYYLYGKSCKSKEAIKPYRIDQGEIIEKYKTIKKHSDSKTSSEKKAQSKLVILNNENEDSGWFCIDVEYVKSFKNKEEKNDAKFNARFDIIALSKETPHRVALIELKYGSGAIGGKSGVYKHVEDFSKFCKKRYYEEHLKEEIINIVESQKEIGISVQFDVPREHNLLSPEFYFITLNNNAEKEKGSTPKQTMAGYLFEDKRWGCKRLTTKDSVEKVFGDITRKENKFHATFLFSTQVLSNLKINDIIDGDYDERIPEWSVEEKNERKKTIAHYTKESM